MRKELKKKTAYGRPALKKYGALRQMTQGNNGSYADTGTMSMK